MATHGRLASPNAIAGAMVAIDNAVGVHAEVWHKRLGHFNHKAVVNLQRKELVQALPCLESQNYR